MKCNEITHTFDIFSLCRSWFCGSNSSCTLPYWKPFIPNIKGIDDFKGEILHSKYYDDDIDCLNKTLFIYGYGASALDIIGSKHKTCNRIYVSVRSVPALNSIPPSNTSIVSDIENINENGEIELVDGSKIQADVFFICTGYIYNFPLSSEIELGDTNEQIMWSFYKHVFHPKYPSLAVVGLGRYVPTFAYFYQVCHTILTVFAGVYRLPTTEKMLHDVKISFSEAENKKTQFDYITMLNYFADVSGEKLPDIIMESFSKTVEFAFMDLYSYKEKFLQYLQNSNEDANFDA